MVGVNTHRVCLCNLKTEIFAGLAFHLDTIAIAYLEVKSKLAVLDIFQLILVQVRPPPNPGIDDMGEALPGGHLHCQRVSPGPHYLVCTWSRPSRVRGIVTHFVGWAPLVVMAVIKESSSSLFSFNFFTRDSIALFENASLSPPCLKEKSGGIVDCHRGEH